MIDNVIITVTCSDNDFDMELPANVIFMQLKPVVLKALAKKEVSITDSFRFINNGVYLNDTDTLFDVGIWDGSILTIE